MAIRHILKVTLLLCTSVSISAATDTDLRKIYAQHPDKWPAVVTSDGRDAPELAPLPAAKPTPKPTKVALGERLFNDTRLSRDSTVSCASCYEARLAFTDKRRIAVGIDGQA
jgi:cytochrome c peroxidase|tara:strand:+ start:29 stop:364 length:336 start_codon:yes stop_codon:yes gene_type:complete